MSVGFEIHHPADLQGKGVFFYSGDPVTPKLYAAIGGITPKQLTVNEVLPTLTGGAINVLIAPVARRRAAPVGVAHHAHQHRDGRLRHRRDHRVVGAPRSLSRRSSRQVLENARRRVGRAPDQDDPQPRRAGLRAPEGSRSTRTSLTDAEQRGVARRLREGRQGAARLGLHPGDLRPRRAAVRAIRWPTDAASFV